MIQLLCCNPQNLCRANEMDAGDLSLQLVGTVVCHQYASFRKGIFLGESCRAWPGGCSWWSAAQSALWEHLSDNFCCPSHCWRVPFPSHPADSLQDKGYLGFVELQKSAWAAWKGTAAAAGNWVLEPGDGAALLRHRSKLGLGHWYESV